MAGDASGGLASFVSHILQFTTDGAAGGGTTVVLDLTRELIARGHRVSVLTETESYCAKQAAALGATVYEQPFMTGSLAAMIAGARDAVKKCAPDAIHLHGTRAAFFAQQFGHPRVICTIHGYHFVRKSLIKRLMTWAGLKGAFKGVSDLVFLTKYDQGIGQRWGLIPSTAKTHIIPNGIQLEPIDVPKVAKQIAFPHRLTHPKNPLLALGAFSELQAQGYTLVCAGSGELDVACKAFAKEKGLTVRFAGGMAREETLRLVAESELMLMTSLWEGLPMTILESMVLGTPVVATAVAGIPEIVEDGVNGILIREQTPAEVAKAVRRLEDPVLREKVIANAKEIIAAGYTWDKTFERYLALYEGAA